ncbi:dihydroneopterin aldolase [Propionicicella superfundia]|uniref:dihydroneopterin aldolase n=1 Tax=Propionicicella superfundia TaxID=348582 RepID=UPI00048E9A30|nr:dihydroneopterin aldolase [Propionicicella superfundia]
MAGTTRVELTGIRVFARHGVLPAERRSGQEFVVDVRCGITHPEGDDIGLTVDYAALAQRVHDLVAADPVDLIETVADRVARDCLSLARVSWVEVTVHKPQAPMPVPVADVAVTVRHVRGDDV